MGLDTLDDGMSPDGLKAGQGRSVPDVREGAGLCAWIFLLGAAMLFRLVAWWVLA